MIYSASSAVVKDRRRESRVAGEREREEKKEIYYRLSCEERNTPASNVIHLVKLETDRKREKERERDVKRISFET